MKKTFFAITLVALFAFFSLTMSNRLPVTSAENAIPVGSYGVKLDGSIQLTPTARADASIVGRFEIDAAGNVTGARTLVIAGVGPIPGGDFTCQFAEANANGTGLLVCHVTDALTGPQGRDDSFRYVFVDNNKEMFLTLVAGVPGAVVSGTAKRQ